MKKIAVVVGSRANYSSIKSVLLAIQKHTELKLQLVVCASALLDRYGSVVNLIEQDGFDPVARVYMLIEGESPVTMAKSTGLGLLELPTVFERLDPDMILTVGDRFETMATTLAAAYMNIPIAHTMGGEISGTIDESIRHAVTKFSHLHFPASNGAKERIIRLGECPESIHLVGCPRMDLVKEIVMHEKPDEILNDGLFSTGVGARFDLSQPFLLVSQHPVTTEYGQGEKQITETLQAVYDTELPVIFLWPNADAGSDDIARGMRKWRERRMDKNMHFFKNLSIDVYVTLMKHTACLVGNSSSGIREGAFLGTPVVNIGTRQQGRERGDNVIDALYKKKSIHKAIASQILHGRYKPDTLYGDGNTGTRIAQILSDAKIIIQKQITY